MALALPMCMCRTGTVRVNGDLFVKTVENLYNPHIFVMLGRWLQSNFTRGQPVQIWSQSKVPSQEDAGWASQADKRGRTCSHIPHQWSVACLENLSAQGLAMDCSCILPRPHFGWSPVEILRADSCKQSLHRRGGALAREDRPPLNGNGKFLRGLWSSIFLCWSLASSSV